jgi:hypothetical protein
MTREIKSEENSLRVSFGIASIDANHSLTASEKQYQRWPTRAFARFRGFEMLSPCLVWRQFSTLRTLK